MTTLVESVGSEGNKLINKGRIVVKALDADAQGILDKAEDVAENRKAFGEEVTTILFATLESSLRTVMKANALHKAQDAALASVPRGLSAQASPSDAAKTTPAGTSAAESCSRSAARSFDRGPTASTRDPVCGSTAAFSAAA